jgi:hypothetical protein
MKIVAKADEHDALATLRNAIICGVENPRDDTIVEARAPAFRVVAFEAGQVIGPMFLGTALEFWMLHLKADILEIISKSGARQSFHVLKNEGPRTDLSHGADGFGEHVPRVRMRAVLAAKRERLAWGATGNEVNPALEGLKILGADIALDEGPIVYMGTPAVLVFADGVAAVVIPFDHLQRRKASLMQTDSKSSRSRE